MIVVKRMYRHMDELFEVARSSSDSAKVVLKCGEHDHPEFIVGLMEDDLAGWVVGRKEQGYPHDGNFTEAVEHAAHLLIQECKAIVEVDRFFIPLN